jgi:hypothetical protein
LTKGGCANLREAAPQWQTPKVATGAYSYPSCDKTKPFLNLEGQARSLSEAAAHSPQAHQTTQAGKNGSPDTPTLNPLFVEALMGWPAGWTDCEHAVTALSHWRQRMRGELLRLG